MVTITRFSNIILQESGGCGKPIPTTAEPACSIRGEKKRGKIDKNKEEKERWEGEELDKEAIGGYVRSTR